jgi:hypothetical protein
VTIVHDGSVLSAGNLGEKVPLNSNSPTQWLATDGLMLRTLVGSTVHGTSIQGQDDEDQMGIAVEPPDSVIGFTRFTHYEFRTAVHRGDKGPDGGAPISRAGDLDRKGNPTVLLPLFVPDDAVLFINDFGRELRADRRMFLSKECGEKFKGYLNSQRDGLLGKRSGGTRNQGRADIRARYGFDTKFAMHMVRLGMQGVQLLRDGDITMPMPAEELAWLRDLRHGKHTKDEALAFASQLDAQIKSLLERTALPDKPDLRRINEWLGSVHRRHWGWT